MDGTVNVGPVPREKGSCFPAPQISVTTAPWIRVTRTQRVWDSTHSPGSATAAGVWIKNGGIEGGTQKAQEAQEKDMHHDSIAAPYRACIRSAHLRIKVVSDATDTTDTTGKC